ncbi:hypothetical protein EU642_21840 [Salmonella enterica]|nr:hypothetical protein [Salmonella enterica]EAO0118496.1 hypothetical protein [Salmonella enterica]EAO3601716.1 hypothetical protein [Salmonella enterica]EAR6391613.1 hypothetical protein [Salmonella enterica]EAV1285258.1 hypothetical protein [Salmonella enterica]
MVLTWADNPRFFMGKDLKAGGECLPSGSGRAWLIAWANTFDEFLFVELFLADDALEMLEILNRATGLDIAPTAQVDSSCKIFLSELEKIRHDRLRIHG